VNEDVFRYQEQLYIPGFKDTGFDVVKEVDNG
jgi:hypothetical protein